MMRAATLLRFDDTGTARQVPAHRLELTHDERHMRRKVLPLPGGGKLLVDLREPVMLASGDRLLCEDGAEVEIVAATEPLLEVGARDALHLAELAWHIGNRHLAAQITEDRIFILRDHVIEAMLEGLGARAAEVVGPFQPLRGAYSGHRPGHGHGHDHADGDGAHVHHRHG